MADPSEMVSPANRREWRAWLRTNHRRSSGVWLRYAKKGTGIASVTYDEAVEEALCFGWIDTKVQTIDRTYYRQIFTPRSARSPWSQLNKKRAARLIESGAMTKAGIAAIEAAKADGRWTAGDVAATLRMPRDLSRALAASQGRKNFDAFSPSVRRGIFEWILQAKRPETRARRVATVARMAAKNLRARLDPDV